jgi:hypothetical protein
MRHNKSLEEEREGEGGREGGKSEEMISNTNKSCCNNLYMKV